MRDIIGLEPVLTEGEQNRCRLTAKRSERRQVLLNKCMNLRAERTLVKIRFVIYLKTQLK